jgi:hypothetical protein
VEAVVFAIGSRPRLAPHEAEAIAELLAAEDDPAARTAAQKIRDQAAAEDSGGTSGAVELERDELRQLGHVLETMRSQTDFRVSLGRLHEDVAAALG